MKTYLLTNLLTYLLLTGTEC